MSSGRGRGYTGRHHLRELRPGDAESSEELDAVRTLAELSPRATDPKVEIKQEKPDKIIKVLMSESKMELQEDRPADPKFQISGDDEAALKELLYVDEQYTPLLALLEQFSPGEDGIKFNRKLRHFESTVANMCPDETRLLQVFSTFRAAALISSVTARKLAAVGASFTRQQRQQLLRGALLNVVMQGTFSKLDLLERANPTYLINAANLMGDYFAEARLCNGNKVHILASPLLQYMRALLASDDIRAHRSLATQLMQNGRELLSVLSQELDDLSISIRLRLLTPPPVSIIWLLLSADLCLNKFLPLPNTLQQFYASHLELTTEENFSEVSYGSWKKSPEKEGKSESDLAEKISQNISQISLNPEDDHKPKLRPILGAGAGLLRQEQALNVSQEPFDTWTAKNSLTKRYDLNSWRQQDEEKKEETEPPVFNPTVLPPTLQNYPVTVPDYPPPNVRYNNFPQENFVNVNYLQQGDGTYIQNQYTNNSNFSSQGDFVPPYQETPYQETSRQGQTPAATQLPDSPEFIPQYTNDRQTAVPEKVANEVQKSSRRPIENWRKEKGDIKEETSRNKQKWTRQRSKDEINEDEEIKEFKDGVEKLKRSSRELRPGNRINRRNSSEDSTQGMRSGKTPPRRSVTDVPRNHKYWDHDDRCDKDYNS